MPRFAALLLALALLAIPFALRQQGVVRAEHLLEGEAQALSVLRRLVHASQESLVDGAEHPGLEALLPLVPTLSALPGLGSGPGESYARDAVYVYGLARTVARDEQTGERRHGFVLRAWPLEFGTTGDVEYHVDETGELWVGQNRLGRSGTDADLPPYPDPTLGRRSAPWWRQPLDEP